MLLAIDVGNTNMVFGIFAGEELTHSFRLTTDADRTSDEIGLLVWEYFQRFGLRTEDVEDVIIASVVPQIMHTLTNAILKYCGKAPLVVDDQVDPGLSYGVESDEHLGADRSVACVAAMLWLDLWTGGAALLGAGLACLYYRVMSQRQFGGVTGDLAGFFLQICELAMVLMVAVVQKIEVLV